MLKNAWLVTIVCLITVLGHSHSAAAASMTLEQKYQDVFVSAGYSTALGAAVGGALLAFKEEPSEHLRYIAIGASIGFFAGTAFGTYMVVAPSFAASGDTDVEPSLNYAASGAKERQLVVEPIINSKSWTLSGLQAGMVLVDF